MSYFNWHSGQPDNYGNGQDCGTIGHASTVQWDDASCTTEHIFVCEIEAGKGMSVKPPK